MAFETITVRGRTLVAEIQRGEDGGFVASVPKLRGCRSQGETFDEALRNITEAATLYLEALEKRDGE